MKREAIVERKTFNITDRREIAKKSNCRCAHCGAILNLKSAECTVEHIVPLSKGGTHDSDNLTLLCYDCNQTKDNLVVNPKEYYKHIDEKALREILLKYKYYLEDVNWLTSKNYFPEDAFEIYMKMSKQSKNRYAYAYVKKADRSEFYEIVDFVEEYHKRMGLDNSDIKDIVNYNMRVGAIYNVRNRNGILASIPIITSKHKLYGKIYYMICIGGIPCVYRKSQYEHCIIYALQRMMACICEMTPHNEIVFDIDVPVEDTFLHNIALWLCPDFEASEVTDSFKSYVYVKKLSLDRNALENIPGLHDKTDKIFSSFSKFLQRRMGLKELKS